MEAFERFYALHPEWRGKVTFLQIAPKSRSEIPEYAELEQAVGAAAGRINGMYGEVSWTPIRYLNRVRDGMNLVAKEYVAAQDADDPGVLILSRFAGAAAECQEALLVNPYDAESVAGAIARALYMPLSERRERHSAMLETLSRNGSHVWSMRFLNSLAPSLLDRVGTLPTPPAAKASRPKPAASSPLGGEHGAPLTK
jgi:trehalose 6-phosphate synthase